MVKLVFVLPGDSSISLSSPVTESHFPVLLKAAPSVAEIRRRRQIAKGKAVTTESKAKAYQQSNVIKRAQRDVSSLPLLSGDTRSQG
jgi:hypothetical protein